jgi:hypothetical protein
MLNRFLASVVLVMATATPAFADANSDIQGAMIAFTKLSSYHMEMSTARSATIVADFVSPGRYHVISAGTESIVIGPTMYLKLNGKWQKLAGNMPTMTGFTKTLTSHPRGMVATDLGPRVVGGATLHAYKVQDTATHKSDMVYLDGRGRIVRMEAGTTIMTVSRFNAPVSIQAPI